MKRFLILILVFVLGLVSVPASAISENQKSAIVDNCDSMKISLKKVQKDDARLRVILGGKYEMILTNFITPLNMRMVENGVSSAELVENQNDFSSNKTIFSNDYIKYQQDLEELIAIDCKNKPEEFYEKLETVRQKRKIMEQDTLRMRSLLTQHVTLVSESRSKI
jgi:putative cell wall-binding protein